MIISQNPSVKFTSRANIIRDTEKVCRLLNSEFPMASGTKVEAFGSLIIEKNIKDGQQLDLDYINKCFKKVKECAQSINFKINTLIREFAYGDKASQQAGDIELLKLLAAISEHKLGNCGEFAKICSLICKVNDIDVMQPLLIKVNKKGEFKGLVDHAILVLREGNKKIPTGYLSKRPEITIIDPWLGFVDFAPNVEAKYKSIYSRYFEIAENEKIVILGVNDTLPKISPLMIDFLKRNYPQLIIKKGEPLIKHNFVKNV